jgi:thioredoxin 1
MLSTVVVVVATGCANTIQMADMAMLTAATEEGRVHHANEANFDQVVLNADVPVLVDFYADWCGSCKKVAPILEELAQEATDTKIVKVNFDENRQLATRYDIKSLPSLLVFKDGEVVDRRTGVADKARLKAMIEI